MAKKIYAVRKGHKTGIFETWDECKTAIEGYSGAEYKGFGNIEDAKAYINNVDIVKKSKLNALDTAVSEDTVIAYVDGSYDNAQNRYAFGCVIITPNKEIIKESGCGDDPDAIVIRNVAGELRGAMFVAKWAINNSYKKLEIRHDYEGIAKWVTGEWKAKNKIAQLYIEEMEKFKKSLTINFTKVEAHTNDALNEEADKLAKEALTLGKKTRVQKGDSWFTAEGITFTDLKSIMELVQEEINTVKISDSEIAYGKKYDIILPPKEKITILHYTDKNSISIQGKPQRLFSILVTYITELVDVEKIPEIFNGFFNLDISKENVKTEFKTYLPNAEGKLPEKLNRVLHQAVYNLNIVGEVFDATFLVEPALRSLEGHLKLILSNNGISLKESPEDTQDKFYMFEKNGAKYQLKSGIGDSLDSGLKVYFGRCYTFFNNHRHTLCHWDNPTNPIDTTRLIKNINDAHTLIKDALSIIDEYYELVR